MSKEVIVSDTREYYTDKLPQESRQQYLNRIFDLFIDGKISKDTYDQAYTAVASYLPEDRNLGKS